MVEKKGQNDLPERTFEFAVKIVNLCQLLEEKPGVSRTLANQSLRSGTSKGGCEEDYDFGWV
jgi:hypothetical protein